MALKTVKILADLIEPDEEIVNPDDDQPGVVTSVKRERKRFRIALVIELDDGRTFEIGGSKFIQAVVG
jgi:hypothetical protein